VTKEQEIIEGFKKCTLPQVRVFMQIYSSGNLDASIQTVVENLPPKKVRRALKHIKRTIELNKKLKRSDPIPTKV